MARYLIVANQTLAADQLTDTGPPAAARTGPARFHIVVPATHPKDHASYTEGAAHALAEKRLEAALERFRSIGARPTGRSVTPARSWRCGTASWPTAPTTGVILSTLPLGASRWLKQDLPHRLERTFGLPVTLVTGQYEAVR